MDRLQFWLGEGSLPVMRGLQLADKLQAELNDPNMEANKTCFTQAEILRRLLEIVNTLNDGIKKLNPLPPQENASLTQAITHHHDKSAHSTRSVKDPKHSPRKLKRFLPKVLFKVQGDHVDGHTWRKYGRKMILSKRHPRSYYKCFYKGDLNCPALKQVQQCDDDTSYFDITYIGNHTCEWHHTQNNAVSPLLSPSHSNSYASSPSTQELNMGYVEPSPKICEIESEEEVQNNGITSTTMNRLYSLMELQEMLIPAQVTTSLQVIADSYSFPQGIEQFPQEGHNFLPQLNEQFPAFVDFEGEL